MLLFTDKTAENKAYIKHMNFRKKAIAYYRTSSASGVGESTDTLPRQKEAVKKYALSKNIKIIAEFYDANVRGVIKVQDRPEFGKLLIKAQKENIDMILVENASRFSRDVMVQLMGHDLIKDMGIELVPVDAPEHFKDEDNPTAEMLRIIIAAVSMYEKKALVKKMASARGRIRERKGRCEGRIPPPQEAVDMAKKLRNEGYSYRAIGKMLSEAGYRVIEKNKKTKQPEVTDRVYLPASIKNMIENL